MLERKRTIAIHKKAKLLLIKQLEHKPMEIYSDSNNIQRTTLKHLWSPNIGWCWHDDFTECLNTKLLISTLLLLLTMLLMVFFVYTSPLQDWKMWWVADIHVLRDSYVERTQHVFHPVMMKNYTYVIYLLQMYTISAIISISHDHHCCLIHWGRMTHECVNKLTTNVSDNGLDNGHYLNQC